MSLVFCRRDLYDAGPKTPSVFKFSDVIFALKSDGHPQWRHLIAKISTQLGPIDPSSDVPPGRGI